MLCKMVLCPTFYEKEACLLFTEDCDTSPVRRLKYSPQLPRNGIVFSICTFPTIQLGFWGAKRDLLWETCKREMPDLDIAVIHAVTQKLLAHVTRKF